MGALPCGYIHCQWRQLWAMWTTTGVVGGVAAVCLIVLLVLLIMRRRNRHKAGRPLSHHDGMARLGSFTSTQGGKHLAGRLSAALGRRGEVRNLSDSQRQREEPLVITGSSAWSSGSHQSLTLDPQAGTRVLHHMSMRMVRPAPAFACMPCTFIQGCERQLLQDACHWLQSQPHGR